MSDDGDNQTMDGDEDDTGKAREKSVTSRQNEKLYSAEGIYNAKMKRAEKKRRKKINKSTISDDQMDGDYDFKVDYIKNKGSGMDVEDENADDKIIGKVPMAGLLPEE